MAVKRKIRRRLRRKAPAVRPAPDATVSAARSEAKQSGLMVGGARDPAELTADRMAARALGVGGMASRGPAPAGATLIAPGFHGAAAPRSAARAVGALGAGRRLNAVERGFFEPRFGRDFSPVRVHEGAAADRAARALDARAFANGHDIAFAKGVRNRWTMAHELAHVAQDGLAARRLLRRDLIRQPPGRTAELPGQSDAERQEALTFNMRRYNRTSTEAVLDIVGQAGRAEFTESSIEELRGWQADWRLPADGKIGIRTLEPLARELIAGGSRNGVIWLVIDGHNFSTGDAASITYDRTLTHANASTGGAFGSRQRIRVGPPGFAQGYRGLVHTIRHELDHATARRNNVMSRHVRELRAEVVEIRSRGMLLESMAGLFDDAGRAWGHWQAMTVAEQRLQWANFQAARTELQRRFNASSAATQATHQAMMNNWSGQAAP